MGNEDWRLPDWLQSHRRKKQCTSRHIEHTVDPEIELNPEFANYEFRQYCFEELPKARTKVDQKLGNTSNEGDTVEINKIKVVYDEELDHRSNKIHVYLPLSNKKLISLQENNAQVLKIWKQLFTAHRNHPIRKSYFLDRSRILKKYLNDNNQTFHQYVVPSAMIHTIMTTSHDNSGHNGFRRPYNAVKRHYFWCGMKKDILKYCKHCMKCNLYKTQKYKFERKTFTPGIQPMEFISMDLIGRISPPSSQGHQYALTVICMLTGFIFCIPLKTKNAE